MRLSERITKKKVRFYAKIVVFPKIADLILSFTELPRKKNVEYKKKYRNIICKALER